MKTTHITPLLCALALALTAGGCRKDDPTGALHLTADWQGRTPTAEALTVTLKHLVPGSGGELHTLTLPATGTLRAELPTGSYRIVATHEARNVSFDGRRFALNTDAGSAYLPEPGALSAAFTAIEAVSHEERTVSLEMVPYTHELSVRLHLTAQAAAAVSSIEATLEGTATAIELETHSLGECEHGPALLQFAPADYPDDLPPHERPYADGQLYQATRRLPALHPDVHQVMQLTLTYGNGQRLKLTHDLTDELASFNLYTADTPPLCTDLLLELAGRPGSDIGFNIRPWLPGGGDEDGDAGMEIP